jgi:Uma2 family endonuclease
MSAAIQLTDANSFLAWEALQEFKHEFDGMTAHAMHGCTAAHSTIRGNLAFSVGGRLRARPPRFYGSNLKIKAACSIRYPDGVVVCSPLAPDARVITDPVVIFEILDEDSILIDFCAKNREYEATPSVQRYIILEQDAVAGTQFERRGDDWIGHILRPDAILRMREIDVAVPLAELYEGLDL